MTSSASVSVLIKRTVVGDPSSTVKVIRPRTRREVDAESEPVIARGSRPDERTREENV